MSESLNLETQKEPTPHFRIFRVPPRKSLENDGVALRLEQENDEPVVEKQNVVEEQQQEIILN